MVRLTDRDRSLITYLARRRLARLSQIQARYFSSYRRAAERTLALTRSGYLLRHPMPTETAWEYVYYLSASGRNVAAMQGVTRVPVVRIDAKTMHTLAVSETLDALRMDGEVEVAVSPSVIADAVVRGRSGPLYVEVDLSAGDLRDKARRYRQLGSTRLLIVTHRPEVARSEFANHLGQVLILPQEDLKHPKVADMVREELRVGRVKVS